MPRCPICKNDSDEGACEHLVGNSQSSNPSVAPRDVLELADLNSMLTGGQTGRTAAQRRAFEQVYTELRRVARRMYYRRPEDLTLQPTALVHEAYERILRQRNVDPENRSQFKKIAAMIIRQTLLDYLRRRRAQHAGGDLKRVTLDDNLAVVSFQRPEELIALDDALNELERLCERQARVVECRYFGGLSLEETADELNVSRATVVNDWKIARLFLLDRLKSVDRHQQG